MPNPLPDGSLSTIGAEDMTPPWSSVKRWAMILRSFLSPEPKPILQTVPLLPISADGLQRMKDVFVASGECVGGLKRMWHTQVTGGRPVQGGTTSPFLKLGNSSVACRTARTSFIAITCTAGGSHVAVTLI